MKEGITSVTTFLHSCKDQSTAVDILCPSGEHKWKVVMKAIETSVLENINHCPFCGLDLVYAMRNVEA